MCHTTTLCSNRVFGCMKGATDGGLDVPHNEKRFPGYDRDSKSYDVSCFKILTSASFFLYYYYNVCCVCFVGCLVWLSVGRIYE